MKKMSQTLHTKTMYFTQRRILHIANSYDNSGLDIHLPALAAIKK